MSTRNDIAQGLIALLTEIPELVTIRVASNLDDKYPYDLATTDLPAVKFVMNQEGIDYHPGHRALNSTSIDLFLYLIEWDKYNIINEEDLVKALRDKLGNDISLKGSAHNTNIETIVKIESTYPLIMYKFNIAVQYERSTKNL